MPAQPNFLQPRKLGRRAAREIAAKESAILEVLSEGPLGSGPLAERTGEPRRTIQRRLGKLKRRGLVLEEPRGTFRLTATGQGRVLVAKLPKARAPVADPSVLELLPDAHRAFLRLLVDAIVARRALFSLCRSRWPGFVLLGPSKSGKTLLAELVCRRFGLEPTMHIRVLARETRGSIWGRRITEEGGAWRFERAVLLARPFATFDEYDKAPAEVQRAAQAYRQGDSQFVVEDERAWVHATPLVILNNDRGTDVLPDAYLRRSVVLDTTAPGDSTTDIDEVARTLGAATLPRVAETIAPPERALPEDSRRLLRDVLKRALTKRGWVRAAPRALAPDDAARVAACHGRADYWRAKIREAATAEEIDRLETLVRQEVLDPVEALIRARAHAAEAARSRSARASSPRRRSARRGSTNTWRCCRTSTDATIPLTTPAP